MSVELKKEIELEIAHVLFLDIVGYSKLSVNEQHAQVEELTRLFVCASNSAKQKQPVAFKDPTGDGMALVFYKESGGTAQCAVEISRALKDNAPPASSNGHHSDRSVAGGRKTNSPTSPEAASTRHSG